MFGSELMLCLSSLIMPQAPPPAPALVMQEIPLRGIVTPAAKVVLPSRFITDSESDVPRWAGLPAISASDVTEAIHLRFFKETDAGELLIDGASNLRSAITLRGSKEMTQSAASYAAWLERSLARGVQIDVRVYAIDAVPVEARGTYAPGGVANLGGLRPLWSGTAAGTANHAVGFDAVRSQPVMIDFDVEVAQKADIADPKVSAVLSGLRAAIVPFAFAGGDDIGIVANLGFGIRRDDGESWSSGVLKQPLLDTPRVDRTMVTMSGRVPNGGSLVAWAGGDSEFGSGIAIEIALRWRGQPPQVSKEDAVLPVVFGLTNLDLRTNERPEQEEHFKPGEESPILSASLAAGSRPIYQPDEIDSLVRDSLGEAEGMTIVRTGTALIVHGTSDQVARARDLVVSLVDNAAIGVDVLAETRSDDGKLVVHRVLVPTLLGMACSMDRGREGVFVKDLDVEIAQSSTAMNPVIEHWFSGLRCEAVVSRAIGGVCADVGVDLSLRAASKRRALEGDRGGAIDVAETDGRRMVTHCVMERGEAISLGQGLVLTRDGASVRTQQSVTVR